MIKVPLLKASKTIHFLLLFIKEAKEENHKEIIELLIKGPINTTQNKTTNKTPSNKEFESLCRARRDDKST